MKIVCDNCATKYSIADEKVRGKVFKIRCKKCSHIIVVRGNEGAGAPQEATSGVDAGFAADDGQTVASTRGTHPTPAPLASSEAVWHLVIDREQIGPLTPEEVRAKFAAGEIDIETYSWREGFADWLRLGSIDDFRDLGGAAADAANNGEGSTKRTDTADLFGAPATGDDVGASEGLGDLFGSPAAPPPAAAADSAPAGEIFPSGGVGLFGAPAAAAPAPVAARASRSTSLAASTMSASEVATTTDSKMTGQRNENSVLFSLNNLQALAGGGTASAAPKASSSAASAEARAGFASSQTEGSGLIDIRAMAASTLASSPGSSTSKVDDGPGFNSAPLFTPMAAPILMPSPSSGAPKWIWALVGIGLLAVVACVVVAVLIVTRKPEAPPVVAANVPVAPAPAAAPPVAAPPVPAAAPAAAAEPKAAEPGREDDKGKHRGKEPKAKLDKPGKVKETAPPQMAAPPAVAAAPAAPPKKAGKHDDLDDLLNQASPDKPAPKHSAPREEPVASDNLPEQLDKGAIVGGMSKVKSRVASCYEQFKVPGLAQVAVTIAKSGRVQSANVTGSFAGTPTGDCVERAVKGAAFPPFKGAPQSINYPFMLR
jgi:predicted Zn finger-like uncharacterized protein